MLQKHLVLILLFSCSLTSAEVYTWINKDGGREYGDEPNTGAKKAQLPALQTISDKQQATSKTEQKTEQKTVKLSPPEGFTGYSLLNIVSPKEDQMIVAAKGGNASIQLNIQPPLQSGHEVSLIMDGKVVDKGAALYFELKNIFRGSHLLQAKIKHKGKLLISSPKRRIHVQRPSILNR
jgi:hypothetical protein